VERLRRAKKKKKVVQPAPAGGKREDVKKKTNLKGTPRNYRADRRKSPQQERKNFEGEESRTDFLPRIEPIEAKTKSSTTKAAEGGDPRRKF